MPEQDAAFREGVAQIAVALAGHYRELLRCGFTEEQALRLTIAFQSAMLGTASRKKRE